jgi:hypothetical protein
MRSQSEWSWSGRLRFGLVSVIAGLLIAGNLVFYLPMRVSTLRGLYNISSRCLEPFKTTQARQAAPALVLVHVQAHWFEYSCLQDLNSPFLDTDFLIALSRTPQDDAALAARFTGRRVLFFYTDTLSVQETERVDMTKQKELKQ